MKKSISAIIIAVIASVSISAHAQWTDRNTFGLKGPVKVVYDTNNGDLQFTENGKYIPQTNSDDFAERVEYNASGKIEYIVKGLYGVNTYKYNNSGLLIEIEHQEGTSGLTITSYIYDTKGKIIKQVVKDCYVGQSGTRILSTTTTTYTYQKIDSYGNWTKRTALTNGKRTEETRLISYFSEKASPSTTTLRDLTLFELKGPVKTCKGYGPIHCTLIFSKDGSLYTIRDNRYYNEIHRNNLNDIIYLSGRYYNDDWGYSCKTKITFTTDKSGKISKTIKSDSAENAVDITATYTYDTNGNLKKEISYYQDGAYERPIQNEYSDYIFDAYGNWISRKKTNYDTYYDTKSTVTETRVITYYK